VIRNPSLLAALGVLAGFVCGPAVAVADPSAHHGRDAGRPPPGAYERFEPMRAVPGSDRREPGYGGYGYGRPLYAPPPYPSAPPRRLPFGAMAPGAMRAEGPGIRSQRLAPLGSVLESIQRRSPGHHLDAYIDVVDGRQVYRVLWVTTQGRRMDMVVDAESGAILSER
jgi:hypothetical protein